MIRCKDLEATNKINCIYKWFEMCPPQGKLKHWVDGRSAKETAKHWLHTIPYQFITLLQPFKLSYKLCSPEYITKFDSYRGNGRNHDLLILAENESKDNVIISIESKVDESFGEIISDRIGEAKTELLKNPNSKALNRIEDIRMALFGKIEDNQLQLRYQLMTAIAGTLAEAKAQNAKTAILLFQTFISSEINVEKKKINDDDIDSFIELFSTGKFKTIPNNSVIGAFKVTGNNFIPNDVDLWIGKYEINI